MNNHQTSIDFIIIIPLITVPLLPTNPQTTCVFGFGKNVTLQDEMDRKPTRGDWGKKKKNKKKEEGSGNKCNGPHFAMIIIPLPPTNLAPLQG